MRKLYTKLAGFVTGYELRFNDNVIEVATLPREGRLLNLYMKNR